MITGSIGLALVAAVFLVLGVLHGPELFYYASIATSLLAALALVAGLRLQAAQLADAGPVELPAPRSGRRSPPISPTERHRRSRPKSPAERHSKSPAERHSTSPAEGHSTSPPARRSNQDNGSGEGHGPDLAGPGRAPIDTGLPDEPPEQPLTPAAAAQLSRAGTEVVVVDGRPRFHLVGCLHLLGRETQRLPVLEAMEGGFTPCALCQPAGTSNVAERST